MVDNATVLILGVGEGLGAALARRFAAGGFNCALVARDAGKLAPLVTELTALDVSAQSFQADATDEAAVVAVFAEIEAELGPIEVAIYNAANRVVKSILEMTGAEFEKVWRGSCLGGMFLGREAARCMVPRGHGSIFFTGATASVRGRAEFGAFAAAKFGLRALAQSMARELGPKGVHVAHFVIDGGIDNPRTRERAPERVADDGLLACQAIAETYYQTHLQHRSAWSQEIDLRPWREQF